MDHFGIGSGVLGAAKVYFQSSRRTGKTLYLVDSLKNGDRVVFTSESEGRRVKSLCEERGVDIEVVVCEPTSPNKLFSRPPPKGDARTILDHDWVEKFYANAIVHAQKEIDHFERELSGQRSENIQTNRQKREQFRWPEFSIEVD